MKTSTIPIAVGALGLVIKGTVTHLETIPGKKDLAEIQNIVLTSTAHILRKRCQYKLQQKRLAQNKNAKTKKKQQTHVKNIPSSFLRFWVETQQLDCSKLRTKETIIIIIALFIFNKKQCVLKFTSKT